MDTSFFSRRNFSYTFSKTLMLLSQAQQPFSKLEESLRNLLKKSLENLARSCQES